MGAAMKKEEVTTKVIYSVPSPAPYVEISKAIHWAFSDYKKHHHLEDGEPSDDAIMVEAWDDEIRIYWIKEL